MDQEHISLLAEVFALKYKNEMYLKDSEIFENISNGSQWSWFVLHVRK